MSDFSTRARALVEHIELNPSDPGLEEELDTLRALWRSLPDANRAEAAGAARALAKARTAAAPPASVIDDPAAQLALSGLDRIDVDAPPERRYDGPRDPDELLNWFGLHEFRPGQREIVATALAGRDSLVVMPTGGGKSL
jgi:superfamily II DNA helicase RecQ